MYFIMQVGPGQHSLLDLTLIRHHLSPLCILTTPPHPVLPLWPPLATTLQGCGGQERARVLAQAQLGLSERVGWG